MIQALIDFGHHQVPHQASASNSHPVSLPVETLTESPVMIEIVSDYMDPLPSNFSTTLPPVPIPIPRGSKSTSDMITILAYCYIMPIICVIGIIGNIMNLVTLASRRLRAVSYMYLRALAVADLLCMIFVLIFTSCEVLQYRGYPCNRYYWYGFYQAHIMLSFINWALATGVFVVVALSLERYVSIIHPMSFRTWNSPKRAWMAIAIAYFIPVIFYVPYAFGRYSIGQKVAADGSIVYNAIDSPISRTAPWQAYELSRELTVRFAPIALLSYLNGRIMYAFRRRQKMFSRLTNRADQSTSSRDDTLLYILGGIVVMFFICNIPAAMNLLFINETVKKRVDYQIFRAAANLLEITNHAAQFYIFCACSTDYRSTFLLKFPCFQAYYTNRDRFKSLMRRHPRDSSEKSAVNGISALALEQQLQKRSTTATVESAATTVVKEPNHNTLEKDAHLASGEEDLASEESDSLLGELQLDTQGTTYL
uniref:G_PROTEIN_RECEP_F1_2 domain-containing protein n=1 Tax=Panagrellus redivivus TaxID=6233 RepID=A0A7E4VPB6_PANRE